MFFLFCLSWTLILVSGSILPDTRIIGGHEVDIIKHPYIVSIKTKITPTSAFFHKCAGSIYSKNAVITVAQCIGDLDENNSGFIVAGGNSRIYGDGRIYPAIKWFAHEDYNPSTIDNDIGIIFIEGQFDFASVAIQPIPILNGRPIDGSMATIAGWGYREEYGPSSLFLEDVHVPIVRDEECKKIYGSNDVTSKMICAGDISNGGKDGCQGDTGGPLVFRGKLVGLLSWGRGCGRPGYPSVYTFVEKFTTWIDKKIGEHSQTKAVP